MNAGVIAADFDRARQEMLIDLEVLAKVDPRAAAKAIASILAEMQRILDGEDGQ